MESVARRRKTAETAIDSIVMTVEECVSVLIAGVMSG